MKKIINTLALSLIIGLLLVSCDSPLSDIEINDPSLINCVFTIERTIENGSESEYATAILTDKNLGLVQLKNGSVKVNNQNLGYYGFTKTYHSDIQVELNTQYTFTVVLANGEEYSSSVITPANDFGNVGLPNEVTINSDVPITWTDFNSSNNIKIMYQVLDHENVWHDVFETTTTDDGSYAISNDNIQYSNSFMDLAEAKVILIRNTDGNINPNFRGGSITSNFRYSQTFDFVNN